MLDTPKHTKTNAVTVGILACTVDKKCFTNIHWFHSCVCRLDWGVFLVALLLTSPLFASCG